MAREMDSYLGWIIHSGECEKVSYSDKHEN